MCHMQLAKKIYNNKKNSVHEHKGINNFLYFLFVVLKNIGVVVVIENEDFLNVYETFEVHNFTNKNKIN